MIPAVTLLVIVGICVLFGWGIKALSDAQKRAQLAEEETFRAFAEQRGWNYVPHGGVADNWWNRGTRLTVSIDPVFHKIPPISQTSGTVRHLIEGEVENVPFDAFEHWYVVSTGKSTTTVYNSFFALKIPGDIPEFQLAPSGLMESLKKFFGYRDVATGHSEFDEEFWLTGEDELALKSFFNDEICRVLRQDFRHRLVRIGDRLVVVKSGRLVRSDVDSIATFFHRFWDEIIPDQKMEAYQELKTETQNDFA